MIIDIHTHTYPDKIAAKTVAKLKEVAGIAAHGEGTVDDLSEKAGEAGVD